MQVFPIHVNRTQLSPQQQTEPDTSTNTGQGNQTVPSHANQELLQQHKKRPNNLNIKAKVIAGIHDSFAARMRSQKALQSQHSAPDMTQFLPTCQPSGSFTVGRVQQAVARSHHMSKDLDPDAVFQQARKTFGNTDMVQHELTRKRPGEHEPDHVYRKKTHHMVRRYPFV